MDRQEVVANLESSEGSRYTYWLGDLGLVGERWRSPEDFQDSPMEGGPKNGNQVYSIFVFVFNALSYSLCRQ